MPQSFGGPGGNRTHIRGFAVRYITILPPDQLVCPLYLFLQPSGQEGIVAF